MFFSSYLAENDADETECVAPLPSDQNGFGSPTATDIKKDRRHNPMSQISVLRSISRTSSGTKIEVIPKYGVDNVRLDLLEPVNINIHLGGEGAVVLSAYLNRYQKKCDVCDSSGTNNGNLFVLIYL